MASASEKSVKSDFTRALGAHPGHYSFFATVRRLEQLTPECPRIGTRESSLTPIVHFAQVPHLYFPPSELFDYTAPANSKTGTLQVYFFGLFGPNGSMPLTFTEYVHERSRHYYDLAMQRFADIFHDRLIGLFYRAGTCSQVAVSYDRPTDDPLSHAAAALTGVPITPEPTPLPALAPIGQARELAAANTLPALKCLLENYFQLPVTIRENTPCHLSIPEPSQCRLGRTGTAELGHTSLLGDRQRSITESASIELGPMSYTQYQRFRPGSLGHERLKTWLHLMSTRPLRWQLHFHITTTTIPAPTLSGAHMLGGDTILPDPKSQITICTLTINP